MLTFDWLYTLVLIINKHTEYKERYYLCNVLKKI